LTGRPPSPAPPAPLKVATYNVHRAIGADGRSVPARVLAVLQEIDPDVIALQELDLHRDSSLNMLDYLARNTGLISVAGPTMWRLQSRYGNAVLTRLPILDARRIDLTLPGREPRGALDLDLEWCGGTLHLIATHLGLNPGERRLQVRRLLQLFDDEAAELSVLLGDLNEWFLWGRPLRWLKRKFPRALYRNTFPARFPCLSLDRIWVNPPACLLRLETHVSRLSRVASDHLPLKALIGPCRVSIDESQ
jgi:endonuclease/exonuclease/phosphatase family metal-dependent hydrolase